MTLPLNDQILYLRLFRFPVFKFLLGFWFCISPTLAFAHPEKLAVYLAAPNGKAVVLNLNRNRLYVGLNSSLSNLYVFSLDENGNTKTSQGSNIGCNTNCLALDAKRDRLYIGNYVLDTIDEFYVCTLTTAGDIETTVGCNIFKDGILAMALDPQRRRIYLGTDVTIDGCGIGVIRLDSNGNTVSSQKENVDNQKVSSLALDAAANILYMGCGDGQIRTWELDDSGDLTGSLKGPYSTGENKEVLTLALDSVRERLHAGLSANPDIYTFDLSEAIPPVSRFPTGFDSSTDILCFNLDATRNCMYLGIDENLRNDLRWVDLDNVTGYPTGSVSNTTSGNAVMSIALDAQRQRLYTASSSNSTYYSLTDPPMPSFWIGDGETTTKNDTVYLKWCVPNARFVYVDNTNFHLDHFYFPVPGPPSTAFNEWISADGCRWSNDSGPTFSRANTLTVEAKLKGPNGLKTIKVWFSESTGASNVSGLMRCEVAEITLDGDTPTFTHTITPSHTPTPSQSPTPTYTPTSTVTPSQSPSSTCPPTSTVTGTISRTPTITRTRTITPTYSITPTCTISPTITPTATITPTLPPTPTCTPCAIFYLDKNRFTPGRESLKIRVGVLKGGELKVTVFTLAGRKVWQVRSSALNGGYFRLEWDGRNQEGQASASGVYFVVLESNGRREIRKVLLIK